MLKRCMYYWRRKSQKCTYEIGSTDSCGVGVADPRTGALFCSLFQLTRAVQKSTHADINNAIIEQKPFRRLSHHLTVTVSHFSRAS